MEEILSKLPQFCHFGTLLKHFFLPFFYLDLDKVEHSSSF